MPPGTDFLSLGYVFEIRDSDRVLRLLDGRLDHFAIVDLQGIFLARLQNGFLPFDEDGTRELQRIVDDQGSRFVDIDVPVLESNRTGRNLQSTVFEVQFAFDDLVLLQFPIFVETRTGGDLKRYFSFHQKSRVEWLFTR